MVLKKATVAQIPSIWIILQQAIEQRKRDGSQQWQNGYPNEQTIQTDIANGCGYVIVNDLGATIGYVALIFGIEPAYYQIDGQWLTNEDYLVVHRVAVADTEKGKGTATFLFTMIEDFCKKQGVSSIRVDTNFDNVPMLRILQKANYTYCGEVFFNGAARRAYEKIIK